MNKMKVLSLAAIASCAVVVSGSVGAVMVRPIESQRVWQTCLEPSAPLTWAWADGTDSARVTFVSLCDGKSKVKTVSRAAAAVDGTCAWPSVPSGAERLYDVTLEQLKSGKVAVTKTARVAFIPGATGGAVSLRDPDSNEWQEADAKNPMFAYDADWTLIGASEITLRQKVGSAAATERALDGTAGYDVVNTAKDETTVLSLLYDGVEMFSGACKYLGRGMILLFQ